MTNQPKAERAQKSDNRFLKGAIVGGAVGLGLGGLGGYFAARKALLKKTKEDCKKAYKKGYDKGTDDATKEAQEWFDENIVVVDSDKSEDIQKAIAEHAKIEKNSVYGTTTVEVTEDPGKAAEMLTEAYDNAVEESTRDMDDWDLSIDGEDAELRSEERARYLDLIDQYQGHPEEAPMHISRKDFEEECYLEKDWVTYYAGDNVFASDQDADNEMDGFANFGVVNGNDLFATRYIDDEGNDDPNIVYIRNFGKNTVYEVTRTAGSWKALKSGEAFLDGRADQTAGDG